METIGIGLAGALFLYVFYSAIRNQWPESYVTMTASVESFLSASMLRYLSFRLIPVYVTLVFAAVTAGRVGVSIAVTVAIIIAIHIAFTNSRAAIALLRRRERSSNWINLVAFNSLAGVLLIATGVLAAKTYTAWEELIPNQEDTTSALWTAALAAVLAVFLRNIVATQPPDEAIFDRARSDLGDNLWDYAAERATIDECDADLIRSILIAEVIQRPAWTRSLERLKGKVLPRGTYGVAQIGSDRPITDQESIDLLCRRFAHYQIPRHPDHGYIAYERLRARLEQHNPSTIFIDQVISVYDELTMYFERTRATASDGRPVIEVSAIRRLGQTWKIDGTAMVFEGNIVYATKKRGREFRHGSIQANLGAPGRGKWSLSLPLVVDTAIFWEEPMDEDAQSDQEARTVTVHLT